MFVLEVSCEIAREEATATIFKGNQVSGTNQTL